ncbi:PREDICTED: uncharacterized protein LOC104812578 [Tarenaya hassleriana]|uniref:uncharacterized protein LOC104812578 n=1 Tax=Tarenaya hassleriana TaxID=28532 RepID=UPI00053C41B8|nr:PREDICTED: uncharacterized protein LOC104812578 [Tarenaya hassleriana]
MHAKTDSEVTSLAASSPTRSPGRRPVYYVQSPSRDSHDGEKTATSFHSTPVLSPMGSPPHSQSSMGRHSRESSSSRFSGSLKPGSRKISPNDGGKRKGHGGGGDKQWRDCEVIEEECLLDNEEQEKGLPRRCYVLAFLVGFFVLFTFFSLILYGAAKPQKPKISVKSIRFEQLKVQAGSDSSGVGTDMITMNATLRMMYRNTGTFFGVHVTSSPIDIAFSQITIGSGAIKKFYQSRKSERMVVVNVIGDKIPLYGSGSSFIPPPPPAPLPKKKKGAPPAVVIPVVPPPVPMKLTFTVRSRAYVLGKLVQPKFYKRIECDINYELKKLDVKLSLVNNCTYS